MPLTSESATAELREVMKHNGIFAYEVAEKLGRSTSWVSRKLNGVTQLTIDDYSDMKRAIESIPARELA